MTKFSQYNFNDAINKSLKEIHFDEPTPVQEAVISLVNKKKDIIVQSETGSGKTHAFLLPAMNALTKDQHVQLLIATPSRELAYQIYNDTQAILKNYPEEYNAFIFVGGADRDRQKRKLEAHQPQIAIGTPGRLWDLIRENDLHVEDVQRYVIDEADMTLDMGFLNEVDHITDKLPEDREMMVFSATIPQKLEPFLKKYMHGPQRVEIKNNNIIPKNVDNWLMFTHGRDKKEIIYQLMTIGEPYLVLVFANTKKTVDEIYKYLRNKGLKVARIHGGLTPRERKRTMKQVENMEYQFVVATDLAARGIDINGVSHVINAEIPTDLDFLIHRIGRTGRNKMSGTAITFYEPGEENKVAEIEHMGIKFEPKDIKNGEIVDAQERDRRDNRKATQEKLDTKLVGFVKKQKTKRKPGYKKKIKKAINDERRQERKVRIRQDRRREREARRNS
ncbi:DEAD-box ATP-dependent RNA helicase CshB [Companilactobacillus crustorum]|uniref:ATP-dependent RNA helicase n=3 Tax=Companilactobacillus TaxID=2767879 RepID=A0A837RHB2_9LACO|nr:DEAD/DEAH box helicase [Companilactobacillus crustorum]HCD06765.1 ATP-dependent helicase [Lactobacillus sp.]APU70912.1 DEAD-box ATP-dependent RNA helicase CshB [Companilactobacillus crustorum]KRK42602.1 ATP-dependent RNA helicase [Companilactobacillus crustorum JCM 15951]KRO20392.1 ATP-dependent RNA helicase [Companilactobacillus crustorum]WDT66038.1 DEAD/DEAH box helicase [Companilactobacillus crustorum]